MDKVKVRIAPSPTGNLHVGTAQSALYNWLFAQKKGGQFFVRIEDTDEERSDKKYEEDILAGFKWLGIGWNGSVVRSSENKDKYRLHLEQLLNSGKAFWCDHSKDELEEEQKRQINAKEAPRHLCSHKKDRLLSGQVIRLNVDTGSEREIRFNDEVRGEVIFREKLIGDFAIARNLDSALYHFAVVIDDIEMNITHVLRGEDHLSNTPKHILIYEALRQAQGKPLEIPGFVHLPLLLGTDRSKLSKRNGQTSLNEYKKDYLPEAMVNFLAAISHTYSKEILAREELIEEFDLKKIHKSGAVFDIKKLNWINSQYIRNLEIEKFRNLTGVEEITEKALPLITERLEKLSDVHNFDYFWKEPSFAKASADAKALADSSEGEAGYVSEELLRWKKATLQESLDALKQVGEIIKKSEFKSEILRKELDGLGEKLGDRGLAYWPLRVALTGREKSPDPVDVAVVLGKDAVLKRIKNATEKL